MGQPFDVAGSGETAGRAPRQGLGQKPEPGRGREPVGPQPVAMGDRRWRRGLARRPDDPHAGVLGLHEQRIVRALCEGLSREEVARRIQRSRSTLDKRIGLIYAATGFTAAYQVVAWAHRVGLCRVARGANGAADPEGRARALAEEVSS